MPRLELTIPVPMWMYLDKQVLEMYVREMWEALVRQASWEPEDDPDIQYAPHPERFESLNVGGSAHPLVIPSVPVVTEVDSLGEQIAAFEDHIGERLRGGHNNPWPLFQPDLQMQQYSLSRPEALIDPNGRVMQPLDFHPTMPYVPEALAQQWEEWEDEDEGWEYRDAARWWPGKERT